jgi:hypothetical protein
LNIEFREKVVMGSMRPSRPPLIGEVIGEAKLVADKGVL